MDKKDLVRKHCAQAGYVHSYANGMAPLSERQMPLYSQIGKGLRGDSATIDLQQENDEVKLIGKYFNQMTEQVETVWELPMLNLVPKLHYEVWRGVREIDGEAWWGYFVRYTCDVKIGSDTHTFWVFDTPFAVTSPCYETVIPEDHIIDTDGGE